MAKEHQDSPTGDREPASDEADPERNTANTELETYGIALPDDDLLPPLESGTEQGTTSPNFGNAASQNDDLACRGEPEETEAGVPSLDQISDIGPVLLDGISFVRRHGWRLIVALGLSFVVGNQLVYALAYASLVEYVVSPPVYIDALQGGKLDIGYYVAISEFRGFAPAIFMLVLFSPWIGYRCFEIFGHTAGRYPDPPITESKVSSVPLQAASVACVIYATALPGFFLGLRGAWWLGATILIHLAGVALLSGGLNMLRMSALKRWQPWIVTSAATIALCATFALCKWGVSTVARDVLEILMDATIFRSSWVFLLVTIGSTAIIWTTLTLFLITLAFVYARLLGQFARSIADLTSGANVDGP